MLACNSKIFANRAIYVDGFENILGDVTAENNLLTYAQNNGIETLLLYGLHVVNSNHDLSNTASNFILADFINKAKTNYGVLDVAAIGENANFFANVIDVYNNSRSNPLEKFDTYNLEFEYWSNSATGPGGNYCTTYLIPNGLPCSVDGAFQHYISTLQAIKTLATYNIHSITTEAYVGWTAAEHAEIIGSNLDRLRLHAYVSGPNTAFNYSENRLIDFANGTPGLDVSIIFSSEPNFMQSWLINNSIDAAENIYTTDYINASSGWANNINLEGFTYFAYTYNTSITLSTDSQLAYKELNIYPNPVQNMLNVENFKDLKNIRIYSSIGQLVMETKGDKIDFSNLSKGIYILQLYTDKDILTKKIMKK
tara:strand:- start:44 stop:1144 length:1101 start_codon:yes stop_codon:yes gene_type:complete